MAKNMQPIAKRCRALAFHPQLWVIPRRLPTEIPAVR